MRLKTLKILLAAILALGGFLIFEPSKAYAAPSVEIIDVSDAKADYRLVEEKNQYGHLKLFCQKEIYQLQHGKAQIQVL